MGTKHKKIEGRVITEQNTKKYSMRQGGQIPETMFNKYTGLSEVRKMIQKRYPLFDIAKGTGYYYWFSSNPQLSLALANFYTTSITVYSATHQSLGKWIQDADRVMSQVESDKAAKGLKTDLAYKPV